MPALRNGLLIDKSLSVAVAAFQRHVAGPQTGIFSTELTGLAITLAFRQGGIGLLYPQLEIIVTDDRGNEYRSLHRSHGSRCCIAAASLRPANCGERPRVWIRCLLVSPGPASWWCRCRHLLPLRKLNWNVRCLRTVSFKVRQKLRVPLNVANPVVPDFGFTIPAQLALAEGSTIVAGKDIRGKIGRLTVGDSFIIKTASGFGPPKTIRGLSLSLPVELTNLDYNQCGPWCLGWRFSSPMVKPSKPSTRTLRKVPS